MRLLKTLVILVVVALVIGAICLWRLPADVGYRYGARYFGPLSLAGVSGTVWDGHADGVSLFGNDLGELDWTARKQPLLRGDLVTDIRIKGGDIDIGGVLTRRSNGAIEAEGLRFSVPASRFEPLFDGKLRLLGTVSGVLDGATWWNASRIACPSNSACSAPSRHDGRRRMSCAAAPMPVCAISMPR